MPTGQTDGQTPDRYIALFLMLDCDKAPAMFVCGAEFSEAEHWAWVSRDLR